MKNLFVFLCRKYDEKQSLTMKKILLKNDISELRKLFQLTDELQQELELTPDIIFNLNLALEEAVTNTILYAYPGTEGEIELTIAQADDNLYFTITDKGVAFNPLTDAPEADVTSSAQEREIGGLGVFLFTQLMDLVEYERNCDSNILRMTKKIK